MGIRKKIILFNGLVMCGIFAICGILFYYAINKNITIDVDEALNTSAEILERSIHKNFFSANYYFFEEDLEELIPKDLSAEIVDKNGVAVYQKKEFNVNISADEWEKIYLNKKIYKTIGKNRILIYPFDFYGKKNVIILGNNIENLQKILKKTTTLFFIIMFFILGMFVLASGLIVNGILQAIKVISDSTKQIEKNNLKYRINNLYNTPEIDELILTLNEMLDRIESGFEKISQFSSDVSHELKTPLASIKGMIEVELSNNRTIEDYKETMIRVLEECNWLISIINDLLLLTRIEAEKEERRFKKINITKLIGEICELLSLIAEENSVKIIFKEEKAIYINGDSDKLKRMILNLISNAVKYNKHDGFIKIRIKENSDIVIIEVEDSGIGIKKENIEKVFERFYREDKIRTTKKSGSGLGLSIADTIVKFHNGKIIIESEEGEGTIIKVELPKN